jgi:antitoxin VapB
MTDHPPIDEAERVQKKQALMDRLWAIAAEIKANMPDDVTSDHNWLYDDETGLPI